MYLVMKGSSVQVGFGALRERANSSAHYCPVAEGCSWCSAYNYQVFGTINKRATFICEMHKAQGLAMVYYWNSFYKKHGIDAHVDLWCPKQWAVPIIGRDEYEYLAELTESLGGFVNRDRTAVRGYSGRMTIEQFEKKLNETK